MPFLPTHGISAAEAGVRDPFESISKLLISPDVEVGYSHWPTWFALMGHIEEEHIKFALNNTQPFTTPELSEENRSSEISPTWAPGPSKFLVP